MVTRFHRIAAARVALGLAGIISAAGCSSARFPLFGDTAPERQIDATPQAATPFPNEATKTPPLELDISQAFVDSAKKLHVAVKVTSKSRLATDTVEVALIGLEDGNVLREEKHLIRDVVEKEELAEGEVTQILFEMDLDGLTEYQVACRWGDEVSAQKLPPESLPDVSDTKSTSVVATAPSTPALTRAPVPTRTPAQTQLGGVTLDALTIEKVPGDCEGSVCGHSFVVMFDLVNGTSQTISEPAFAVALLWVNEGQVAPAPPESAPLQPNEERIQARGTQVASNNRKRVRMTVDRQVPEVPGGAFVPRVRYLSSGNN